jgi:pimeloyl-ACP methyl ester carboxylesterase
VGAYPTERWYFINGICTDQHWLQLNCQQLEAVFERPVVGIYNETNGIVVDIIESFAQRNLHFPTQAARDAADFIRQDIRNGVNKVVLIGHSQGGIIVSIVLQLLNRNELAKLSAVFTFACAVDEFPNPRPKALVIEHYANRNDLVAELGPPLPSEAHLSRTTLPGRARRTPPQHVLLLGPRRLPSGARWRRATRAAFFLPLPTASHSRQQGSPVKSVASFWFLSSFLPHNKDPI